MKTVSVVKTGFIQNPRFVGQVIALAVVAGIMFGASPALADDALGGVVTTLIESVTGIIQSIAIGAGILGLSIWAIGKVLRPVFPQVSGMTQNYIPDLLIGVAVVFVASEIVEGIAGALGGS